MALPFLTDEFSNHKLYLHSLTKSYEVMVDLVLIFRSGQFRSVQVSSGKVRLDQTRSDNYGITVTILSFSFRYVYGSKERVLGLSVQ